MKIDLAEIRRPFIRSGLLAAAVALLVVLAGTALFFRIGNPMIARLEAYSRDLEKEIEERELAEAQLRQAQKMEALGQLTGGIAHDFNNLLTIIIGNLEILEERAVGNDEVLEPARAMLDASIRGAQLTKRLLAFSRKQVLEPKNIDVNRLVEDIEPLIRTTLGEDISIKTRLADDLWLTEIDPSQLENSIVNLAVNAGDAMPGGGQLTIETRNISLDEGYVAHEVEVTAGDYVVLSVSDTGMGIPADILSEVFDPFFTTKGVGKGSGLGLSMVYGFVKQSKGHIKAYSEEGHGTVMKIYLPRSTSDQEDTIESTASRIGIPSGNETILVVEDDAAVLRLAVNLLEPLGYRVLTADSGPTALTVLKAGEHIDLLFTDMIMPGGMTGAELASQASKHNPKLKVLFTSGYTDTTVFSNGMLARGNHILNKPYRKEELAKQVRFVLDEETGTDKLFTQPKRI
ncbi:MAG: response regulator [Proteobacteria bacterium]|nr:response regulator [Pseudomonadota bacterium]